MWCLYFYTPGGSFVAYTHLLMALHQVAPGYQQPSINKLNLLALYQLVPGHLQPSINKLNSLALYHLVTWHQQPSINKLNLLALYQLVPGHLQPSINKLTSLALYHLVPGHQQPSINSLRPSDIIWWHRSGHYLNHCWPRSLTPYAVTRPQCLMYQEESSSPSSLVYAVAFCLCGNCKNCQE